MSRIKLNTSRGGLLRRNAKLQEKVNMNILVVIGKVETRMILETSKIYFDYINYKIHRGVTLNNIPILLKPFINIIAIKRIFYNKY